MNYCSLNLKWILNCAPRNYNNHTFYLYTVGYIDINQLILDHIA